METKETKGAVEPVKPNDAPAVETVIVAVETKKIESYTPKTKSKKVWIRHKPIFSRAPYQDKDAAVLNKIGSSYSAVGQDVLRGLTFEEEVKFLGNVIGTNPKNEHWEKHTKEYWANISKTIPPSDEKGEGGLELEVGRIYFSKEEEDHDEALNKQIVVNEKMDNSAEIESKKIGKPINLSDFVLWRYCLVYNRVANNNTLIHKSPKIDFYIYSKEEEIVTKKNAIEITRKANQLFYSKMANREWIDWVLRIFVAQDKQAEIFIKDLDKLSSDEKDIELEKYVKKSPELFVSIGNDESLELRSFIELCIAENRMVRLPNTDTILYDTITIGNTTGEAVAFLKNPKNSKVYDTLKAQIKLTP